jgi:hypothetical protein
MPTLNFPLDAGAARLEVLVGVSAAREAELRHLQQPIPPVVRALAEIDSGAAITGIDRALLVQLSLQSKTSTSLFTPATGAFLQSFPLFDISLILIHPAVNYHMDNLPVVGAHLAAQGIQVLLGRDVLAHCVFIYNGPADSYTLCF